MVKNLSLNLMLQDDDDDNGNGIVDITKDIIVNQDVNALISTKVLNEAAFKAFDAFIGSLKQAGVNVEGGSSSSW